MGVEVVHDGDARCADPRDCVAYPAGSGTELAPRVDPFGVSAAGSVDDADADDDATGVLTEDLGDDLRGVATYSQQEGPWKFQSQEQGSKWCCESDFDHQYPWSRHAPPLLPPRPPPAPPAVESHGVQQAQ